jgi:hypothetical protein
MTQVRLRVGIGKAEQAARMIFRDLFGELIQKVLTID